MSVPRKSPDDPHARSSRRGRNEASPTSVYEEAHLAGILPHECGTSVQTCGMHSLNVGGRVPELVFVHGIKDS